MAEISKNCRLYGLPDNANVCESTWLVCQHIRHWISSLGTITAISVYTFTSPVRPAPPRGSWRSPRGMRGSSRRVSGAVDAHVPARADHFEYMDRACTNAVTPEFRIVTSKIPAQAESSMRRARSRYQTYRPGVSRHDRPSG